MSLVEQEHSGAMVAVMAPPSFRKKLDKLGFLASPGVEPESLHVTLLYLGKSDNIDDKMREQFSKRIAGVAKKLAPIDMKIGGFGSFVPGKDGAPIYASVTGRGLSVLQAELEKSLGEVIDLPSEHGWVPHLTLGYLKSGEGHQLPDFGLSELPGWLAQTVSLVIGDDVYGEYPLGNPKEHVDRVVSSMVDSICLGISARQTLDEQLDALCGSKNRSPLITAFTESRKIVQTYFDSYGDLRFITEQGVLINELSPEMVRLSKLARESEHAADLMDGYSGTLESLCSLMDANYSSW
jgi:2'-5' RNA ligase